jgi:hypothetical protein
MFESCRGRQITYNKTMETTVDPKLLQNLIILSVLTVPLKGWALWRAAHGEQKGWFIAMLFVNTLGILELTYLFYFSKSKTEKD